MKVVMHVCTVIQHKYSRTIMYVYVGSVKTTTDTYVYIYTHTHKDTHMSCTESYPHTHHYIHTVTPTHKSCIYVHKLRRQVCIDNAILHTYCTCTMYIQIFQEFH